MTTIRKSAAGAALLAAALVGGACATGGRDTGAEREAMLIADNQNFKDATVYAVWDDGTRERLGTVTGLTRETFALDVDGRGLQLEVDFLAGRSFLSDELLISPGEHLQVTIPPSI